MCVCGCAVRLARVWPHDHCLLAISQPVETECKVQHQHNSTTSTLTIALNWNGALQGGSGRACGGKANFGFVSCKVEFVPSPPLFKRNHSI